VMDDLFGIVSRLLSVLFGKLTLILKGSLHFFCVSILCMMR
jgi:hypothetical protein